MNGPRSMLLIASLTLAVWSSGTAMAVPVVFKYDQFDENLTAAANQINGQALATQPGFVQTEAFGQIYRPAAENYPLKIIGIDLILAAPPNASSLTTHAQIEVWNSTASGPNPGTGTPMFQISTTELYNINTGDVGVPLQGNVGLGIDFDYDDPEGHPELITSGNIWVMIRFTSASKDMTAEWTNQCEIDGLLKCGCQNVGSLHDYQTTSQANVMHIVEPDILSGNFCSGNLSWKWMEDVGPVGDFLIRLRTDANETACVPSCGSNECGDDGCGGSCGNCASDEVCKSGQCEPFCLPDCAARNCGDDGCGGSCGTCTADQTCTNGVCEGEGTCNPPCASGQTCIDGECTGSCTPDCSNANCGDDGCGGSCGTCAADQVCTGRVCAGAGALSINEISPSSGEIGDYVDVAITGTGFQQGLDVLVGGKSLAGIKVTSGSLIQAQIPPDVPEGTHTVIVVNPDSATATLAEGYTAVAGAADTCGNAFCEYSLGESHLTCPRDCAPPSGDTAGCSTTSTVPIGASGALALFLLAMWLRSRQRPSVSARRDRAR